MRFTNEEWESVMFLNKTFALMIPTIFILLAPFKTRGTILNVSSSRRSSDLIWTALSWREISKLTFFRECQTADSLCGKLELHLVSFVAYCLEQHVRLQFQRDNAAIHSTQNTNDLFRYNFILAF